MWRTANEMTIVMARVTPVKGLPLASNAATDNRVNKIYEIRSYNTCDKGTDCSEQGLANEQNKSCNCVHNHSREEITRDKIEAFTCGSAETISVHCLIKVTLVMNNVSLE